MTWRPVSEPPEPEVRVIAVRTSTTHGLNVGPMACVAHRDAAGEWWSGLSVLLGVYAWAPLPVMMAPMDRRKDPRPHPGFQREGELEQRIADLEAMLTERGIPLPPEVGL